MVLLVSQILTRTQSRLLIPGAKVPEQRCQADMKLNLDLLTAEEESCTTSFGG